MIYLFGGDLVESWPGWDVVPRQSAFHQPLHPQAQAVQFVVDLQGGGAAGAVRFAGWEIVTRTGSHLAPRRPRLVLRRLTVMVLPRVDGFEQAQVLLVAVQSEHVARVVDPSVPPVVLVGINLHGVLSVLQQRGHPLAVLVQVQEGEVQRQTPGRHEQTAGIILSAECLLKSAEEAKNKLFKLKEAEHWIKAAKLWLKSKISEMLAGAQNSKILVKM